MIKRLITVIALIALTMTGCKSSHKIETASIIENVSVHRQDGRLTYTFYILTDSDSPEAVAIPADSFEEATKLAQQKYIPDMSLNKLELLLIEKDVCGDIMQSDIAPYEEHYARNHYFKIKVFAQLIVVFAAP